jgi:hypothetical protein
MLKEHENVVCIDLIGPLTAKLLIANSIRAGINLSAEDQTSNDLYSNSRM